MKHLPMPNTDTDPGGNEPSTYTRDARGLHPLDSGTVYAVRFPRKRGGSRREFFKTPADAHSRARWHRETKGREVTVLAYTVTKEREVTE